MDKLQILYRTMNSTVYGNEHIVIKEFTPMSMHYVDQGKILSPKQEALLQKEMGQHVRVPTVLGYDHNSITMIRLPHVLAGENLAPWIIRQLAESLQRVHEAGYVHTDIKRQNLALGYANELYLMDWNGATEIGKQQITPQFTKHYSAPELKYQVEVTPQMDMYSLGCIGYKCFGETYKYPMVPQLDAYVDRGTNNWTNRLAYVRMLRQCVEILPENRPETLETFVEICSTLERPFSLNNVDDGDTIIMSDISYN